MLQLGDKILQFGVSFPKIAIFCVRNEYYIPYTLGDDLMHFNHSNNTKHVINEMKILFTNKHQAIAPFITFFVE